VIREIVMCLHYTYGVKPGNVLGVHNGYRGFYEAPMSVLTPEDVSNIQREVRREEWDHNVGPPPRRPFTSCYLAFLST
jgi:hypothetical protein